MIVATIEGRKRKTAIADAAGEPQPFVDESPMVIRAADARALLATAKSLIHEYLDAPEATISIVDGEKAVTGDLKDFLLKAGVKL